MRWKHWMHGWRKGKQWQKGWEITEPNSQLQQGQPNLPPPTINWEKRKFLMGWRAKYELIRCEPLQCCLKSICFQKNPPQSSKFCGFAFPPSPLANEHPQKHKPSSLCSLLVPFCTQCWAQPHTQLWAPPKRLSSAGGISWSSSKFPLHICFQQIHFPCPQPGRSSSSFSSHKTKLLLIKLLQQGQPKNPQEIYIYGKRKPRCFEISGQEFWQLIPLSQHKSQTEKKKWGRDKKREN